MPSKYHYRRVSPSELSRLMHTAGMKVNDFLAVSGRHIAQIGGFLAEDRKASFTPTMGDVMLLELVARGDVDLDRMLEIAGEYSDAPEIHNTRKGDSR